MTKVAIKVNNVKEHPSNGDTLTFIDGMWYLNYNQDQFTPKTKTVETPAVSEVSRLKKDHKALVKRVEELERKQQYQYAIRKDGDKYEIFDKFSGRSHYIFDTIEEARSALNTTEYLDI